jgi:predicted CoA-binding protein
MKKTIVIGASPNPTRYAYLAMNALKQKGIEAIPVGIKKGVVAGEEIRDLRKKPALDNVHTVTLYIGPANQPEWYEYIISLKPQRIIFNPGTENREFIAMAENEGIEAVFGCTLVMLSVNNY